MVDERCFEADRMTTGSRSGGPSAPTSGRTAADFDVALASAQDGEGWAFEWLYRQLAPTLTAFATGSDAADPRAATNEIMIRVFHSLNRFQGDSLAFRTWVFSMARRYLAEPGRGRSQDPGSAPDEGPERPAWIRPLSALTPEGRDLLLLRILTDLSIEQVAQVMDKPVSAAKALQRRGLRLLEAGINAEAAGSSADPTRPVDGLGFHLLATDDRSKPETDPPPAAQTDTEAEAAAP